MFLLLFLNSQVVFFKSLVGVSNTDLLSTRLKRNVAKRSHLKAHFVKTLKIRFVKKIILLKYQVRNSVFFMWFILKQLDNSVSLSLSE
jgi:hypothetical protein